MLLHEYSLFVEPGANAVVHTGSVALGEQLPLVPPPKLFRVLVQLQRQLPPLCPLSMQQWHSTPVMHTGAVLSQVPVKEEINSSIFLEHFQSFEISHYKQQIPAVIMMNRLLMLDFSKVGPKPPSSKDHYQILEVIDHSK
jgi:hypothetical protein